MGCVLNGGDPSCTNILILAIPATHLARNGAPLALKFTVPAPTSFNFGQVTVLVASVYCTATQDTLPDFQTCLIRKSTVPPFLLTISIGHPVPTKLPAMESRTIPVKHTAGGTVGALVGILVGFLVGFPVG